MNTVKRYKQKEIEVFGIFKNTMKNETVSDGFHFYGCPARHCRFGDRNSYFGKASGKSRLRLDFKEIDKNKITKDCFKQS